MNAPCDLIPEMDEDSTACDPTHPGRVLIEPEEWPEIATRLKLTIREWEVVGLLFRGHSKESIARRLKIGERTVRQYFEQVYQKLGVSDRVALVLRLIDTRDQLRRE